MSTNLNTYGFLGAPPLAQVTPFTYREGATMLSIMEAFKNWAIQFGPEVQEQLNDALKKFQDGLRDAKADWQEQLEAFMLDVDNRIMAINNKTGATPIIRMTLTKDTVIAWDNTWTDSHALYFVITQDSVGGHTLKLPDNVLNQVVPNAIPGAWTGFTLQRVTGGEVSVPTDKWNVTVWGGNASATDFQNAYRKRIKHNLPFRFPGWEEGVSRWGVSMYPQTFGVDEVNRELFIGYNGPDNQVFAVWNWDNGKFITSFSVATPQISEGLEIVWKGGRRYMYIRYTLYGIGVFDVTALPAEHASIAPTATHEMDMGRTFGRGKGQGWVSTLGAARNELVWWDDNFNVTGFSVFPREFMGATYGKSEYDAAIPKTQGITPAYGSVFTSLGGQHVRGDAVGPYQYQGIRRFSAQGQLNLDSLIHPERMIDALTQRVKHTPTLIENEAIAEVDGNLHTLYVTTSHKEPNKVAAREEGILIFEEFSESPDAIDFSAGAVSSNIPELTRLSYQPVRFGKLLNPFLGTYIEDLPTLCEYMWESGQRVFQWYSTNVAIRDLRGNKFPDGATIRVTMGHSENFVLEVVGYDLDYRLYRGEGVWYQTWMGGMPAIKLPMVSPHLGQYEPEVQHVGPEAQMDGGINLTEVSLKVWTKVAKLPEGYRPRKYQYYPTGIPASPSTVYLRIQVNGDVEVYLDGDYTSTGHAMLAAVRFRTQGYTS